MVYVLHYDIAALIVFITLMLHFFYKKNISTRQTKLFSYLLTVALLSTVFDIISAITIRYTNQVPLWINYSVGMLYFAAFKSIAFIYFIYIIVTIKGNFQISKMKKFLIVAPYLVEELLIITSYWTHLIFYFNAEHMWTRGPLIVIIYLVDLMYIVASLAFTIKYHKKMNVIQRIAVYFYSISVFLAIIIQMKYPPLLVLEFATAFSLLLIYLSLENPENYEDKRLGVLNSVAFAEVLGMNIEQKRPFEVLGIQIQGLQYVNETFGIEQSVDVMKQIAKYLSELDENLSLYYFSQREFVLVGHLSKARWDEVLANVRERFKFPFELNEMAVNLSGLFCIVEYPKCVDTFQDLYDVIGYCFTKAKENGNDGTVIATKELFEEGRRESQILQSVKRALLEQSFEMYYQPIYSASEQRFRCAEALIRLHDEEMGFISPEEFIPIAEKNGLILEIGEQVFRKVCDFMSRERIWEKGIRYVDVNLSVVQCMQKDLYQSLLKVMDEYHIEYSYVAFEVTETVAVVSSEILRLNMQSLLEKGIHVSLDDYGTGFSNTASLVQFPFTAIKIDKSMLWTAMENPKAMAALKHIIAMIIDMNMVVIAEGVETQEQADLLVQWGCELHQGYLYSKPLSEHDFIAKVGK